MAKAKSLKTRARPATLRQPVGVADGDAAAVVAPTNDAAGATAGRVAAVMSLPPPTGIPEQPARKNAAFAPAGASRYQNARTLGEIDAGLFES